MTDEPNYLFGPVASRRLGLSLGVDVIPYKVCTLDCVYCEVGRTTQKTVERQAYVPIHTIVAQLKRRINQGLHADCISLCGSGEPTLHTGLGDLIDQIRQLTTIPVAIITNSTLLHRADVRRDCAKADIVVPSLDAATAQAYQAINRPHPDLHANQLIQGLECFRQEYTGKIWLELFFSDPFNTDTENIKAIHRALGRVKPDKVQLNTAVRPTADTGVVPLTEQRLLDIAQKLDSQCEILASFSKESVVAEQSVPKQDLLAMLERRPCSIEDIHKSLGIPLELARTYLSELLQEKCIAREQQGQTEYYSAIKL
jgi:wyosine [tRNA(Phe)-imidazoG37] synthetase (radical SAM superfamily)